MKDVSFIKEVLKQSSFIAFILLASSCNDGKKVEDSKEVAEDHNEAKFDNSKQEKDAQFLVNAAEINLEEIQLGKLAQQNGQSADIKKLGRMMEDSHTKSLNDLTALAKSKMMTIPSSPTDDALNAHKKLNESTGNDFDKAYADLMVNHHKDAIAAFEKASTDCNDIDIRNFASSTLPNLRTHLDHSMNYQKKWD